MSYTPSSRPRVWCAVSAATLLVAGHAAAQAHASQQPSPPPGAAIPSRQEPPAGAAEPFTGASTLEREALIREVLARNPSLSAARAAVAAARTRRRQATALEAPMLSYGFAPLSIASSRVGFGQQVELGQELPWPGKLALMGEMAEAEAAMAGNDLEETRLRLALGASQLYDDFVLVHRALAIIEEHLELLRVFKASAEAQYVAGRASQQDPLQAEVETAELLRERLSLQAQRNALRAQLNALLHRPPQRPLPPPPERVALPGAPVAESEQLQAEALERRPELAGLRARRTGREAALRLARLGYFPDVRVMASYNSMWMDTAHQYMAGVTLSLPFLQLDRRRAEVEEAEAELSRSRSEEEHLANDIRAEVEAARERLVEAHQAVTLYQERLLPAARDQVAAARAGFESGRSGFLALLEAERALRRAQLRLEEARADVQRRQAELDRTVGRLPALPSEGASR